MHTVDMSEIAVDGNIIHIQKDVQIPAKEVPEDNPTPIARRPSRPVSIVHPVKSRIVEATFKQVQDKTLSKSNQIIYQSEANIE
jgi:hypothetical protein